MAVEQFANIARSNLNGALNSIATSFNILSASSFPSTGNFRILIDSEIMLVTGIASNTFTVVRGSEGTGATAHADGSLVAGVLTKGSLDQSRLDRNISDVIASKPAAGLSTRLYYPSDTAYLLRDNGSNYDYWGPIYKFTIPISTGFSWYTQGSATLDNSRDFLYYFSPNNNGGSTRAKTAPSTPWKITSFFKPNFNPANTSGNMFTTLLWRENSSGKQVTFGAGFGGAGAAIEVLKWSTPAWTFIGSYRSTGLPGFSPMFPMFFRIEDDGTNRKCSFSSDGYNFLVFHSVGRTDYITADQVGFGVYSDINAGDVSMSIYHWLEQ